MLIRSSFSANIKERRDCSTALFDERGRMIAQAEHIPVHLGAMPDAVAAVMRHDPAPGDVFILNDPYAGGTHLPDVTLVSPDRRRLRGHARAPRRRRRRRAGKHARGLAHARRRGGRDPTDAPRRRAARRRWSRGCATPRSAAATSAPSSPPTRWRSRRLAELCERRGPRPRRRGDGRALRLLGARRPSRDRAPARTGVSRRRTCSRRPRATSPSAPPSPSRATRSRSTSPAPRRSTRATSTARSRSRARPATSSSAA